MEIKDQILHALSNRVQEDVDFDLTNQVDALLQTVGLSVEDSGGILEFSGKDPIVPSVLRLAGASAIVLAAKAVSMAYIWKLRGGKGQDIKIDLGQALHRLSPFYQRKWELLNGVPPSSLHDPTNPFFPSYIYQTKDNKWVMAINVYPRLKTAALRFLNCTDSPEGVAAAIRNWHSADLEKLMNEKGLQLTVVDTPEEFLEREQFQHLANTPLIHIEKIGESDPEPLPSGGEQPLDGIRALGMGHVIAGSGIGRALALHGADVLNIWTPTDFEIDSTYFTTAVGHRSSIIDLKAAEGKAKMEKLLKGADIFFANRRGGYLEKVGLSPEECARIRPGIIHATVSLWGTEGPWAGRIGFDQDAGAATGVFTLEGTEDKPALAPIFVVNDYIMAWLATTGINAALARRAREGGSYRVHVILSRASMWMFTLGIFDKEFALRTAGTSPDHIYTDPETFTADTACGHYQGVTEQVYMSETPGHYKTILVPRGSCKAEWLKK